jgi:hypothetical protein
LTVQKSGKALKNKHIWREDDISQLSGAESSLRHLQFSSSSSSSSYHMSGDPKTLYFRNREYAVLLNMRLSGPKGAWAFQRKDKCDMCLSVRRRYMWRRKPTRCHSLICCSRDLLYMFRALICPSYCYS